MTYLVVGPGGATYGPVDLLTLQAWIGQGRVMGATELVRSDGARMTAMAVPGLTFPGARPVGLGSVPGFGGAYQAPVLAPALPPTHASHGMFAAVPGPIVASYALAAVGFFCIPFLPEFIGMVLAGTELRANRSAAMPAFVLNTAVFVLHILGAIFFVLAFSKG